MKLDFDVKLAIQVLEERLFKTEKNLQEFVVVVGNRLEYFEAHIENLRRQDRELDQDLGLSIERIDALEDNTKELNRFQEITHRQYQKNISSLYPYKCPTCEGNKKIFTEFKSRQTIAEFPGKYGMDAEGRTVMICPTCEGNGIVWG